MKVFSGNQNATDLQVENGCMVLLLDVRKTAAKASPTLAGFLGDLDLSSSDTLKVLYTNRSGGQKTVIPSLPVLPVSIAGTMGPQHIKVYLDDDGNVCRTVLPVLVGIGGALKLDNNSYLSVTTNFANLDQAGGSDSPSLSIYAIDTFKTDLIAVYESIHLNASSQKAISLADSNQLILPKQISDFQLTSTKTAYSVNWSESEMEAVARAQNDILAAYGTDITAVRVIQGVNQSVNMGFQASRIDSGGTWYDALGVSDFEIAKVTSKFEDRAYVVRIFNANSF
jgi:hypothetical protein